MSVRHHPDDALLAAFAAGALDLGEHVAIATHLHACPRCRQWVGAFECAGGEMLEGLAPAALAGGSLAAVAARLDEKPAAAIVPPALSAETAIPGLPDFVRHYRFGSWQWVAPRVSVRPIGLPESSDTRVFLLKSGPGTTMLQHSHSDVELTCVLTGAFSHDGGRFGPGDFDLGDETVHHRPVVEAAEDCICLVAMRGQLRLGGLIGRLVQPFLRL